MYKFACQELKRSTKCCGNWLKNLATLKGCGNNFEGVFLNIFWAESESEVSLPQKIPDLEILELLCLFVLNCTYHAKFALKGIADL